MGRADGESCAMKLLELLGEQKRRQRHSGTSRNTELGLPALLSIAGVIAVVILVAASGVDGWISSRPAKPEPAVAVVTEPEADVTALYLRRKIDLLQAKLDNMEILFQQVSAGNDDLARRLQELEDKLGPYTASLGKPGEPHLPKPGAKGDRASTHFKNDAPARPAAEVAGVRKQQTPRPTQTFFAIQLPSFRTIPELRNAWRQIRRQAGDTVSDLEPRYYAVQNGNAGIVYRLLAGPIKNAAEAARRCARLQARNLQCKTTVFTGEPIFQQATN